MSNKNFEDKKKILYSTKHLKLNEDIIKLEYWNADEISARTQKMIDKILMLYPYKKSNYKIVGLDRSRYITLEEKGIVATGYLNEDNSLTVYQESKIRYDKFPGLDSLKELREDLIEKDIIEYKDGE